MSRILMVALMSACFGISVFGQDTRSQSPKAVVEDFWKFEIDGGRLTPDGWSRGNDFFVRPIPMSGVGKITVIDRNSSVWDPVMDGKKCRVTIGISSLGRLGPKLQYFPPDSRFVKEGAEYRLVLTETHSQLGTDGKTSKEIAGPLRWRIEGPGSPIFITLDTAIRYLSEKGEHSPDPVIRKNAEKTLAALRKYK